MWQEKEPRLVCKHLGPCTAGPQTLMSTCSSDLLALVCVVPDRMSSLSPSPFMPPTSSRQLQCDPFSKTLHVHPLARPVLFCVPSTGQAQSRARDGLTSE